VLIENSFEVPAAIDVVWPYLLDVEKVVVCMPGAELTETVDDTTWKGRVKVKLGPVSLSFAGQVEMAARDDDAHRIVLEGAGMEQRGKGRASATVTTTAEQSPSGGTLVKVTQDLQVQGQVASMSRGMMQDVSSRLTKQFAECLQRNLSVEQAPAAGAPSPGEVTVAGESAAAADAAASARSGAPAAPTSAPTGPPAPAGGGEVKALPLLLGALWGALRRGLARLRALLTRS
jgi:carbon monoxide dehydrogenase subunit G